MTRVARAGAAVAVGAGVLLLSYRVLRSRFSIVRVTGSSMAPTFTDGDRLVVRRTTRARVGDAVVFRNPFVYGEGDDRLDWLVKRVSAVAGDAVPPEVCDTVEDAVVPPGALVVRGDAPRSQDSRHFGYVAEGDLLGVVLNRLGGG
ncbi:S26 family signal peptidase [Streptomyces sp. NPDC052051]|uniref:S26 family signal peptidase n=1 Tax=Streptomyces sp. NPDC052051 TaxID=3154649 RepID=UPI00341E341E